MKKEVEIRYKLTDVEYKRIIDIFKKNNIELKFIKQIDTYYGSTKYVDNNQSKECPYIIRIRESNKGTKLTYKSFVENKTSWIEEETGIDNISSTQKILSHLGQKPYMKIEKDRMSVKFENIEVNIDIIKNLGKFIELEIVHEDIKIGKNILKKFVEEKLSIDKMNIVDKGYVQLMEEYSDEHKS